VTLSDGFPAYNDLDITKYNLVSGVYTLGIIEKHRPDIEIIHRDMWQSTQDYTWLDNKITGALEANKTVGLFIWDEVISFDPNFIKCVLKYQSSPVYVITQLDDLCMLSYKDQGIHNIIEIPWWLLNDCLCYYRLCNSNLLIDAFDTDYNFLCMVYRYEKHKLDLIQELGNAGLHQSGYITVSDHSAISREMQDFCQQSPILYTKLNHPKGKTRANTEVNGIHITANVENFLHIEKQYRNIPLIINPETSYGTFFTTEKSLWPLLLGRLCLISGRWKIMNYMQRFYDVDFSSYVNLEFDEIHGWTEQEHQHRMSTMISQNKNLIKDSKDIYRSLQPNLEQARWTIGKNMYEFFVQQLAQIPKIN
jgi:hypothetical protein